MSRRRKCGWPISIAVFVGIVGVTPRDASGQTRADTTTASQPSLAVSTDPVGGPQMKAFAAMVGEPEALVLQRLSLRPDLIPVAMAAGEVRMERKRSGKIMVITGFSILGAGVVGGLALVASGISANCSNDGCWGDDSRVQLGFVVAAVTSGIGLALGIPGIVRMSSQSSLEDDAVDRYRTANPSSVASSGAISVKSAPLQSPARSVSWPLLSFAF